MDSIDDQDRTAPTDTEKRERDQALYDSFTLLGEDEAEADVEFAFAAQREVVMRHD